MKKPYSPPVFRELDPDDELVSRLEEDHFVEAPMPKIISTIFVLARLLIAAWLLYGAVSGREHLQTEVIAGAMLLSVGVVTSVLLLRDWMKWKRELAKYREG
jgi:hypothetical protein